MNAKKALKKLKIKTSKVSTHSAYQLSKISKPMMSSVSTNDELKHEIKQVSRQTLSSVVSELSTPLTPLLSWFNEGTNLIEISSIVWQQKTQLKPVNNKHNAKIHLAQFPLKSPPCKSCPARQNGLCKCAMKKLAS